MIMKRYTFPLLAVLCGVLGLGFVAGQAIAEPAPVATSIGGPYRPLYVAALVAAAPAVSDAPTSPLVELQALKTAYEKLKANQDPSLKPLLWAGLLAVGLKTLLSLANAIWKKPKKWLAWTAL
ncbi:MAG TPA: hypothetical protein VM764_08480, partial [Gemmatimonadaceae bacterium]|nr:hypothetical protein [Gemmatimonadaceae bacterium]